MSNFRHKLHETLYLSVNHLLGSEEFCWFTPALCVILLFFSFSPFQQMVIIMFAQINEY